MKNFNNEIISFKKKISMLILFFLFSSIFIITSLVVIGFKQNKVYISNNLSTKSFKQQNLSINSTNATINNFLKKNEKLIIKSKQVLTKNDNNNTLEECQITTPNIRKKIYNGKTKIIKTNSSTNAFEIPNKIHLKNNDNGQNNYIIGTKIRGILTQYAQSDKPFMINDDDVYLSGDNFYFRIYDNYLKITKNAHLIYTKENFDKRTKKNVDKQNDKRQKSNFKKYDIKSVKMELFETKNYATFRKNVIFNAEDVTIKSHFGKVYFNKQKEPTDVFISDSVRITENNRLVTADFGYLDIENNLLVLYKNITLTSPDNYSNGELYLYNTKDKTSTTFNENTVLQKKEQYYVNNILKKLAKNINNSDKKDLFLILKKINQNIKKKNSKNSENYGIDRSKRTKVNIF